MADNKSETGSQDRKRINTSEDYEVSYWTKTFDCTKEELLSAVKKVGSMADDVEVELRQKRA